MDIAAATPPFSIELVNVDHSRSSPGNLTKDVGLRYVPTFIVLRDGKEVGRVIESAQTSIESDLLALLRGDREGDITGRPGFDR